ncbi:winged helix DNA-binding domain-containing protein [Phytohabitans sp. LJ34]|uniref:winged helix DNA-binding domain-containing protein n=1 Tax=Phytohabitans sp. LJ34 TaxID=3452217 RepID=UPI003F8C566F
MTATLTWRALGRATLARQHLLERAPLGVAEAVEHLVGMQGQAPHAPYLGLWSRLSTFDPEELSGLLRDRQVVRIALMRGTVHLVTARDARGLRPLTQPIYDRDLRTNTMHAAPLAGLDLAALAAAGRELLSQPRSGTELGALLRERWPEREAASLAYGVRGLLPLVQVPPRGLWGRSGQPVLTTLEAWTGEPMSAMDPAALVTRYLGAFGPATVQDVQTWSGLTGLREVVHGLPLARFRDEAGRDVFDLPDAPRPDPDTPAPVRLLADFDNVLFSHADRTRVIADAHREHMIRHRLVRAVLVDGVVAGTWTIAKRRLTVQPFGRVTKRDRSAIEKEGARLLALVAPGADPSDVAVGSAA